MIEPKIELTPGGIRIQDLEVDSKDVRAFLEDGGDVEAEWPGRIIAALEIGVAALERVASTRDLDYVGRKIGDLLSEVKEAVGGIPGTLEGDLRTKLGNEENGVLKPVRDLVSGATAQVNAKIKEVQDLFDSHLSPTQTTSSLYKSLKEIKDLLRPNDPDSVQGRITAAVTSVTGKDGALVDSVKAIVKDAIDPYMAGVTELMQTIKADEKVAEALEKTTRKGMPFEDRIYRMLVEAFEPTGCRVEHVGGQNKKGDILMHFEEAGGKLAVNYRFIVEAKNRAGGKAGKTSIGKYLDEAMKTWNAVAAIYVGPIEAFTDEARYWLEGRNAMGSWIATTEDSLIEAVRYLRITTHLERRSALDAEVDIEGAARLLRVIRLQLRQLSSAQHQLTTVETAAASGKTILKAMSTSITDAVDGAERALGLPTPTEKGASASTEHAVDEQAEPLPPSGTGRSETIICRVCGEPYERDVKQGRKPTKHPWCKA